MFEIKRKSQHTKIVLLSFIACNVAYGITRSVLIASIVAIALFVLKLICIKKILAVALLSIMASLLAIAHFHGVHQENIQVQEKILNTNTQKIAAEITVIQPKGASQRITAKIEGTNQKITVKTSKYIRYEVGDLIQIHGKFEKPPDFEDFSYSDYLLLKGVVITAKNAKIKKIGHQKQTPLFRATSQLKQVIRSTVHSNMHSPESAFLNGILIGIREDIPQNVLDAFNETSTTHVIAISGYNITIISLLIMKAINGFIPRKIAMAITIVGVALFVLLVGDDAPVVRAGIMGGIALIAKIAGRKNSIGNVLLLTTVVMALINPYTIVFDVAFHLSFFSTIGLIYGSAWIEKITNFLPDLFEIRESVALTITAQIATLPIIIMNFGKISLISVVANTAIAPLLTLAMSSGALAICIALISEEIATPLFAVTTTILHAAITIIEWCANTPFASQEIPTKLIIPLSIGSSLLFVFLIFKSYGLQKKQ